MCVCLCVCVCAFMGMVDNMMSPTCNILIEVGSSSLQSTTPFSPVPGESLSISHSRLVLPMLCLFNGLAEISALLGLSLQDAGCCVTL